LRNLRIILNGLRYAVRHDLGVRYKLVLSLMFALCLHARVDAAVVLLATELRW